MSSYLYLNADQIKKLHNDVMIETGFQPQHCNLVRLEGALFRPLSIVEYGEADLIAMAVLLAIAISQSQAFVDGNKRTGIASMGMVLKLNGYEFHGDSKTAAKLLELVAKSQNRDEAAQDFENWIRTHVVLR